MHAESETRRAFSEFLRHFRREAARHGRSLEEALAGNLQRLFTGADIVVIVLEAGSFSRVRAARSSDAGIADGLSPDTARDLLTDLVPIEFSLQDAGTFSFRVTESAQGFLICLGGPGLADRAWSAVPVPSDFFWVSITNLRELGDRKFLQFLVPRSEELGDLYDHLQATLNIARIPRFLRLIEHVQRSRAELFSVRMQRAMEIVEDIDRAVRPFTRAAIARGCESLARWAVQEVLGSSSLTSPGDEPATRDLLERFFESLGRLQAELRPPREVDGSDAATYADKIAAYRVIACGAKEWDTTSGLDLGEGKPDPLSLLGRWTRLHRFAVVQSEEVRGQQDAPDAGWFDSIELTLPTLQEVLDRLWDGAESLEGASKQQPGKHHGFSAWLGGWMASQMLTHTHRSRGASNTTGMSELEECLLLTERWRLRSGLALLARETFRQVEFGDSPDFRFDARLYLDSLAAVVEHHAHGIAEVPRSVDLRDLLRTIGSARDADDYLFAASHLQHALQVYLAGHFLADLHLHGTEPKKARGDSKPAEGTQTLLQALAGSNGLPPGDKRLKELKQAFSLAALFHDTGMLLFPRVFFPAQELPHGDTALKRRLDRIQNDVKDAAKELMVECERELREAEYFDPVLERPLARWLRDETEAGRNDHSLLGAWYLHRIARESQELPREVVQQAVRAVLLHQVVTQPIDWARDPVAALLVLCDELMDWRPSGRPKNGLAAGFPPLGQWQMDVRHEGSRAKQIKFRGLHRGEDTWSLEVSREDSMPIIEIHLQEPEHLTMEVYKIWLLIQQNLSRLGSRPPLRWQPAVTVFSSVPEALRARSTSHKSVLSRLARITRLPCRAHLERWIQGLTVEEKEGKERFEIKPDPSMPWHESIHLSFEQFDQELASILSERGPGTTGRS